MHPGPGQVPTLLPFGYFSFVPHTALQPAGPHSQLPYQGPAAAAEPATYLIQGGKRCVRQHCRTCEAPAATIVREAFTAAVRAGDSGSSSGASSSAVYLTSVCPSGKLVSARDMHAAGCHIRLTFVRRRKHCGEVDVCVLTELVWHPGDTFCKHGAIVILPCASVDAVHRLRAAVQAHGQSKNVCWVIARVGRGASSAQVSPTAHLPRSSSTAVVT